MRRPLTRDMLLPLPAPLAESISLELHMALEALRSGQSNVDLLARIFCAVAAARRLHEARYGRHNPEHADFAVALQVLPSYAGRGAAAYLTSPSADGMASLERVISLHDDQMAVTPRHLWLEARKRGEHDLARLLRAPRAEEVAAHAIKPR